MKWAGTELFRTVHPMTYLFIIYSITWGIVLLYELQAVDSVMNVSMMFWPIAMAYLWSAVVVLLGLVMLWFLYRDRDDKARNRIWIMAKANLSAWVFAASAWLFLREFVIIVFALISIVGFMYIGIADRLPSDRRRL